MPHISESAPLQISRFYTGWYSYRNPLIVPIRQMGRRIIELYDAISDGLNMEPTNRLTLARRPGYTLITPTPIDGETLYFYTFKPTSSPGQVYQVIDTTAVVAWIDWTQPAVSIFIPLITKTTPALTTTASVGAYMYMAQEVFAKKWDSPGGVQSITKWGIDMANVHIGPNAPSQAFNTPTSQASALPWQNPSSVIGTAGFTTVTLPGTTGTTVISQWLFTEGFGFHLVFAPVPPFQQVPVIAGIEVAINGLETQGVGIGLNVRLLRNGVLYGGTHTVTLPANDTTVVLGSPGDLWDASWTPTDINNATFGVAFQAVNSSGVNATFSIDNLVIAIFTAEGPQVGYTTGTMVAQNGYKYQYCYGNSHSGHISSPTPPSDFPLPNGAIVPNGQGVVIQLLPSMDTQVTDIHVYRTTDGAGLPFFELPNSPVPANSLQLVDNAPDNLLQIASICPDPHFNDAPPFGMVDPCWFAGRLWGHRQHQLFFASGPDVTVGNEAEAWYPVYRFALPNQIVRKFPTPNGMLLVTTDEIYIVRGLSTATFTVNEFMKDIGMRTWTAGDTDGTTHYLYTSDRQFLMISPNGISSMAKEIADQIQVVDPTLAYIAQHRYTAQENMIFIADGSTFVYPFNQELQAWCVRQRPVQGVTAIGNVERSPGVFEFWRGRSAPELGGSLISKRDLTSFADEGIPYPCDVIFGPIPLADQLTLAQVRDLVVCRSATASDRFVSVIPNEIFPIAEKQFEIMERSSFEPPEIPPSLSYIAERFTWKSTTYSELVNLIFFKINFSADANPDEVFLWCWGGTQTTGGSSLGQPGQLPQLQGR